MTLYHEDDLRLLEALLIEKPRTLGWLAQRFDCDQRTIKRRLEELRQRGRIVLREGVGSVPYYIQ